MIVVVDNVYNQLQIWYVNSQNFRTLAFQLYGCIVHARHVHLHVYKLDMFITKYIYVVASSM